MRSQLTLKAITLKATIIITALILLGGAAAANATNFGTTNVGAPVDRSIWLFNSSGVHDQIISVSVPSGYSVVSYPIGTITASSSFVIGVRLNAASTGTFSDYMFVRMASNFNYYHYLTGTVTAACNTSPSVSQITPSSGATVSPNASGNVILKASASDSAGISKVEFFVDGALVATDFTADASGSYAFAWPAKSGSHQTWSRATNSCGNSTTSSSRSFTVNCGNPTVSLTSPANGATVSPNLAGNVILKANAAHSTGIQKVEFWLDGSLVKTDTIAPWAYAWPASSGSHQFFAKALSVCSSVKTSGTHSFTVN